MRAHRQQRRASVSASSLAIEAVDGTVILASPLDAQRLAEFAQRLRGERVAS